MSELPAAKIVIPFKIVTTNSVLRLVVRKVLILATLVTFFDSDLQQQMQENIAFSLSNIN
jgi:hypothetical protein